MGEYGKSVLEGTLYILLSMGLYLGGLIRGRIFASGIWGAYFRDGLFIFFFLGGGGGGAYYRNFTVHLFIIFIDNIFNM